MTLNRAFNPGLAGESAALVDINNDGYLDIIYSGDFSVTPFSDARIKLFMNGTLGVDEFTTNSLKMYPNPSRGEMNPDLPNDITDFTLTLTDMMGRNVVDGKFDISNHSTGTYVVTVRSGSQSVTKRIIKQ